MDLAARIVDAIVSDLRGRCGFDAVWDNMDEEIQAEIISHWRNCAQSQIREEHSMEDYR